MKSPRSDQGHSSDLERTTPQARVYRSRAATIQEEKERKTKGKSKNTIAERERDPRNKNDGDMLATVNEMYMYARSSNLQIRLTDKRGKRSCKRTKEERMRESVCVV